MSQVRKYQSGGNTPAQEPPKPKVGRFTMNGRSLEGQKAVDKILAAYRNSSDTAMGNMAVKAIQDGNEAKYNSLDNSIQIVDNEGNDITSKYLPKGITAKVSDSAFKKRWGATFGTANESFRQSGLALKAINMDPEQVEEPDNRVELRRGKGWFDYVDSKDDKGKAIRVYDTNSSFNKDNFEVIKGILDYMTDSEDVDSKYKYSAWRSSDREQLRNLANEITASEGGTEGFLNTLRGKIESGQPLTDADTRLLNLMGFSKEAGSSTQVPQENTPSPVTAAAREAASVLNPGQEAMYESMGITSTVGEDGRTHITGTYNNNDLSKGTWLLGGNYNWFDPKYKWLHNGILYEGGEEHDKTKNYDLFNAVNNWYQNQGKTSQEWWDHAKASGIHFSGEEGNNPFADFDNTANFDTAHNGAINRYIAGLNLPAIAMNDFTGAFDNVPEGTSIYGYVNPTNRDEYGTMGAIKFFSIDQAGNIADWNQPYGLRPVVNPIGTGTFSTRDEENGNNFVYHRFNLGNEATNNTILTTSTLDEPGRKYYLKREGTSRELDPNRIEELMQAIKSGSITDNKGLESYYLRRNTPWSGNSYTQAPEYKGYTKVEGGLYRQDSTGKLFYRGAYNGLYPYTPKKKEGGIIDTPKLQYGGGINGSNNTINIDNTAKHTIDKAHEIGKGKPDGGLTQAEKLQIAGAIGDLAGVGISFVPGVGNIAGATTGAAASTTRFIGDIKQDGFQGKDLGNYLLNLGLDATSLFIPAVGKTAKGAKALKTIKGLAEPIMMALAVGGATQAAGVMKKIIADEKVTSKDMVDLFQGLSRTVLGGATAVKVGKEAKVLAKESAKTANAVMNEVKTAKVGETTIKKTNKELKDIVDTYKTKTKVAEQLGLSAEQAKKGLQDLGIEVKGRSLTHPFASKERVEFTTEIPTSRSGFVYFNNPFARSKGLTSLAQNTTASQLAAANRMLTNGSSNARAQVLARLSAERPWAFGKATLSEIPTGFNSWTFGGRRWIRLPQDTPQQRSILEDAPWATYRGASGLLNRRVHASYYLDKNGRLRMAPLTYMKEGGLVPKLQAGGTPGKAFQIKLSPLLDLGSAVGQSLAIGRAYDLQREANAEMKKRQIQAPQLIQQRLDLSPIEHKYQLAEEPLRKFKHVSSDNFANLAGGLSVTEQLSGIGMQKGAEISDYINRYNQQYVNTENQQRQLDTQVADEKSAYLTNLNSREKLLNAQELNDKWANVWNTYSQQFRQNIRDAENQYLETSLDYELSKLQNERRNDEEKLLLELNGEYQNAVNGGYKGDRDSWIYSNQDAYNKYQKIINSNDWKNIALKYDEKFYNLLSNSRTRRWLKSGGKLRPTNDELVLQGDKSAKRAVVRMNDHLMKMLIQLMK